MQVPIRIKFTRKCQRCGLRYAKGDTVCPHCSGLTDQQVVEIRARQEREHAGNANLGRLFLYIAGLLIVGMLILLLNSI
jgi:hypothetical protein